MIMVWTGCRMDGWRDRDGEEREGIGGCGEGGTKTTSANQQHGVRAGGGMHSPFGSYYHQNTVCVCASTCLCSYRVLLVLLHELQVPPALLQLLVDVHLLLLSSVVPLTKVQQLRLGVLTLLKHRNGMHVHCLLDILCRNT